MSGIGGGAPRGGGARKWRGRRGRGGEHGLDWLYACYRLLGEGKPESHSAQQLAVDIDRTAAHALQDTGLGEWAAGEAGEDDGLLGRDIFEQTEDFHLELFDA